jgi:hypothetical protein
MIQLVDCVYLRVCRGAGESGTVVRWAEMDYWGGVSGHASKRYAKPETPNLSEG